MPYYNIFLDPHNQQYSVLKETAIVQIRVLPKAPCAKALLPREVLWEDGKALRSGASSGITRSLAGVLKRQCGMSATLFSLAPETGGMQFCISFACSHMLPHHMSK